MRLEVDLTQEDGYRYIIPNITVLGLEFSNDVWDITLNKEVQSRPRPGPGRHVGCISWRLGSAWVTRDMLAVTRVKE